MSLPRLYLISDADRVGEERFLEVVTAAVGAGLRMLQLREPGWPVDRIRRMASRLAPLREELSVVLSCHPGADGDERERLVSSSNLVGVHLGRCRPEAVLPVRQRLSENLVVGYSAHTVDELTAAFRHGADYVSFSPVFPPRSKETLVEPHGLEGLRHACENADGPVYALGGITTETASSALQVGAAGIAVIGAITDAEDVALATRALLAGP